MTDHPPQPLTPIRCRLGAERASHRAEAAGPGRSTCWRRCSPSTSSRSTGRWSASTSCRSRMSAAAWYSRCADVAALVRRSVHPGAHRRRQGRVQPLDPARRGRHHHHRGDLLHAGPRLPQALRAATACVFYLMIGSLVAPGLVLGIGVGLISMRSASRPAGTPRRSARICPGRCRSACWSCSR